MNYDEKFAAINAIGEATIKFRRVQDWYVSQRAEIKNGCFLKSVSGNGLTPAEAIADHWRQLVEIPDSNYIVISAMTGDRRAVRWNGFMWADVQERATLSGGNTRE